MPLLDYMNAFRCKITGSTSNVALAKAQIPRRCGKDPEYGKPDDFPGNCTYGAKQPFYWFQRERNNVRIVFLTDQSSIHAHTAFD